MPVRARATKGCPFGSHRANGGLPQAAESLDANPTIWSNELLIDVEILNLDSSSMRQITEICDQDIEGIVKRIGEIVRARGKMHNPVTGSGGVLIGRVALVGPDFPEQTLHVGDRICTLVSLSLTPLVLERIDAVDCRSGQVVVCGHAVLFETGLFSRVPPDIPLSVSLALFDVAGAPGTVVKTVRPNDTVCILGSGKAGVLSLFAAREALGQTGRLIAIDHSAKVVDSVRALGVADETFCLDVRDSIAVFAALSKATDGMLADLTVNTTNIAGTEGASILVTKDRGRILFFSMATSFTRAALTAEGVGRDVQMLIGNGYTSGWVDTTLRLYRDNVGLSNFLNRVFSEEAPLGT